MNVRDLFHETESEQALEVAREARDQQIDISEAQLANRVQVVLAQKRTSLSVLRTGIGLLTLPMTIVAFLVTTSRMWDPGSNLIFLIPLFVLNTALVIMGLILITRAWTRIRLQDKTIEAIKAHAETLGHFVP